MPSNQLDIFARFLLLVLTCTLVSCNVVIPAFPSPTSPAISRPDLSDLLLAPENLPLGWIRETYIVYETGTLTPPGNGRIQPRQQQAITLTAVPAPARGEDKGSINANLDVRQVLWVYDDAQTAAQAFAAEQEVWGQFTHEPPLESISSQLNSYLFRYNYSQFSNAVKCQYVARYDRYIIKIDIWLEGQGGEYEWKTILWEAENRLLTAVLPAE